MKKMHSHDFVLVEAVWLIFLITGIPASITQGPSNTVAEIGQQVKLNCTDGSVIDHWYFSKDGTDTGILTIVGSGCSVNSPFGDHYRVDPLGGGTTCNLIVFNITMEQAGVYKCEEIPDNISSILTVIDSPPVLTVNSTPPVVDTDRVIIECRLNYNGSVSSAPTLRPYFFWTTPDGDNVSSTYDLTTDKTAVSQRAVTAGHGNITPYTCHVQLRLSPPATAYYANNTPTVESSASSPVIEVLYGAHIFDLEFYNYQLIAIGGTNCEVSVVTCNAHGNPPPIYEWFDTKENVIISNERILDLAEINRNYTCVVYNTFLNEVHRDSHSGIPPSKSSTHDCKFPRSESTWISATPVEGCDSWVCDCSSGYDGFNLTCNANSYPSAAYQWIGADNSVIFSKIYENAHINGLYRCTAYFDQPSSSYTGNVTFPNGTTVHNVIECDDEMSNTSPFEMPDSSSSDVAIAMGVLFGISVAVNIVILVIWVYTHLQVKKDQFKRTENVLRSETLDLSNRTSASSAYEELNRPDETRMQQSTYEALAPNPTKHVEPNIEKAGLDINHTLTQENEYVNAKQA